MNTSARAIPRHAPVRPERTSSEARTPGVGIEVRRRPAVEDEAPTRRPRAASATEAHAPQDAPSTAPAHQPGPRSRRRARRLGGEVVIGAERLGEARGRPVVADHRPPREPPRRRSGRAGAPTAPRGGSIHQQARTSGGPSPTTRRADAGVIHADEADLLLHDETRAGGLLRPVGKDGRSGRRGGRVGTRTTSAWLRSHSVHLRPGERATVLDVFAGLSDCSRSLRFLGAKPRLPERDLDLLVDVGCCGREAVVAVEQDSGRAPVGTLVSSATRVPEADIAFEVVDEW